MSAAVRPIYFPSDEALEWVQQRALSALEAWAAQWRLAWTGLEIRTVSEPMQRLCGRYQKLHGEAGRMWIRCAEVDRLNLGRAVVGAELIPRSGYPENWIAEALACAWDARNHALCTALLGAVTSEHLPGDELPENQIDVGAGALQLSCASLGLHVIVDSGVWHCVPAPLRAGGQRECKLAPLERAMDGANVVIEAVLGSVEIELAQLLSLTSGDVVSLPLRLNESIEVRCEGRHLASGVLREMHGRRCVRLSDDASNGKAVLDAALPFLDSMKVRASVRVGSTHISVAELTKLQQGGVLPLDQLVDEPLEVLVNDMVVAAGALVAVGDRFGLRITESAIATSSE
jgi:flagellar motor switch protein FliN